MGRGLVSAEPTETSLPPSLQVLLDKDAIRDVLMRYYRGADRNDCALMASVFHPDAVLAINGVQHNAQELVAKLCAQRRRGGQHVAGNVLIEVEGDIAYSECYWVSFATEERDGTDYSRIRGARSIDRFERRDGEWRIAARRVVDSWSRLDRVIETVPGTGVVTGRPFPDDEVYRRDR